jgi:hypothetical protein
MSSESRMGTLTSSAPWLGALAKGTAADPLDGGALTLRWTLPTDEQAHERRRPFGPLVAALSLSLGFMEEAGSEMKKQLGFGGALWRRVFVRPRAAPSCWSAMDGSQRVGLDSAHVGGEKVGPGLCCFNIHAVGLVTRPHSFLGRTRIGLWAGFGLVFLSVFSFSRNRNKPV